MFISVELISTSLILLVALILPLSTETFSESPVSITSIVPSVVLLGVLSVLILL